MSVYFTSDLHLGHNNALSFRPEFSTIEEHDDHIVSSILSCSGKRNQLYILGDVLFTQDKLDELSLIVKNFQSVHIVLGNHDLESKKRPTIEQLLSTGVTLSGMMKYKEFWLTHEPIHPSELRGKFNIHGHVHRNSLPDHRYFNVSIDERSYQLLSLDQIREFYNLLT